VTEPLWLIAAQGDESYSTTHGSGNAGLDTFEVARIWPPGGDIGGWTTQANESAHFHHGHGGALYLDYLFTMPGVLREGRTPEPEPDPSATARFTLDVEAVDPATVVSTYEGAGATLDIARSYYGTVRVNSYIFVVAGNDGAGPIDSLEQHYE
jgi:hypothetical protein